MRENTPSLKNRRKSVYVFLGIYVFLALFIIVESALPGDISAAQSNWISGIWANIVNVFKTTRQGEIIYPTALSLSGDSSFLGNNKVAIGTTSLLTYKVTYPEATSADVLDPTFNVTRSDDSEAGVDYNLVISTSTATSSALTGYVRVVGLKEGSYSFKVTLGEESSLSSTYSFDVVPLEAPGSSSFIMKVDGEEVGDGGITLALGESQKIDAYLVDGSSKIASYKTNDGKSKYMARYLDSSLLEGSETIGCKISSNGVITASEIGDYSLKYGGKDVVIHVTSGSSPTSSNTLSVSRVEGDGYRDSLFLLDYDYPSEDDSPLNNPKYGLTLKASYSSSPSDARVHWNLVDSDTGKDDNENPLLKLRARIVSSWYDEASKSSYCYVQGYREEGNISVKATSNSFSAISALSDAYNVTGAIANSMTITGVPDGSITKSLGDSVNIGAIFDPANTANCNIVASDYDTSILKVGGNGTTTLLVSTLKEGTSSLTIASVSNPSIPKATVSITVTPRTYYNDSNISGLYTRIRKGIGHFGLFFLTSIIAFIFFHLFFSNPRKDYLGGLYSLASGFSLAFLSEAIQGPVAGRTGLGDSIQGVVDVFIDGLGFSLGLLIIVAVYIIIFFIKSKKAKPQEKKEET